MSPLRRTVLGPAGPPRKVLLLSLGSSATVLCVLLIAIVYFRGVTIDAGRRLNASFAQIIEEQTSRSLQAVDERLELAGFALQALQSRGPVSEAEGRALFRRQIRQLPLIRAMWLLDAQGRISLDSDVGNLGLNLADRPYFQVYVKDPAAGFRLANPVRSRTTGSWLVTASRPLRDASGQLLGVLAVAVEPPYFDQLWKTVDLGEGGAISLIRRDGTLIVRSPFDEGQIGRQVSDLHIVSALPVLLPTGHSALRSTLDHWLESLGLRPTIVGEFEDSALLAVFAARGLGVFPASRLGADPAGLMRGLRLLGRCDEVKEEVHAIRSRRGQHHPLVLKMIATAKN